MVKVKLRVPLSSAPRETSSPLANPLRSAPDYSDDDEPSTPLRDGATPDDHNAVASDAEELDEDQDDDDDEEEEEEEEEDQEADELDELDELEADDDALSKTASSSTLKRRSITLKSRSSKGGASSSASASASADGSASPHSGASRLAKRGNLARIAQVHAMSVEELDALPAAKRRKTAKARGAAGPGRGWRKGLTKGQKPVYELPTAETTPATFGNTADARSSPAAPTVVKAETPTPVSLPSTTLPRPKSIANIAAAAGESSSKPSTPSAATRSWPSHGAAASSSSIKIVSGPGGHTFTGDLSAKAGTAKNPGFRYPPLPSSRAGPPVQPIARIPTSFQAVIPLERNARQPRRWTKGKREILSMGGRPWSIPVFYGREDRGYEKKVDAPAGAAVAAVPTSEPAAAAAMVDKVASKAGTPSAPATAAPAAITNAASPAPSTPLAKGGSPLPPPKHLNGLNNQSDASWRGQSPAYLFGGR